MVGGAIRTRRPDAGRKRTVAGCVAQAEIRDRPVEASAVRGGSWNNNMDNARAAARNNNHPNNDWNNNGFRVGASHDFHFAGSACCPTCLRQVGQRSRRKPARPVSCPASKLAGQIQNSPAPSGSPVGERWGRAIYCPKSEHGFSEWADRDPLIL